MSWPQIRQRLGVALFCHWFGHRDRICHCIELPHWVCRICGGTSVMEDDGEDEGTPEGTELWELTRRDTKE